MSGKPKNALIGLYTAESEVKICVQVFFYAAQKILKVKLQKEGNLKVTGLRMVESDWKNTV